MIINFKFKQLTHLGGDLMDARIAELNYFMTVFANDVIVLFVAKRFFVQCLIVIELMLFY